MSSRQRPGRKGAGVLNLVALVVSLMVLTAPLAAQEVAQAQSLVPTGQAQDLVAQAAPKAPVADAEEDEPVDLLSEFNVTAQRRRTTERENTQTTYVVNREQIKNSGATTVADALKLVPSINFVDDLGGIDNTAFNQIRGLDDARFILLVDGRPLTRASNNRAVSVSKVPTVNVERIEVVTGGSTLRYGADAIAGVINVITQLPEGPPKVKLGVNLGSYGFSQYSIDYSGSNGIDKNGAGYVGYNLGYERRSVLNNFTQSFKVNPPEGGIVLASTGATQFTPFSYTGPAFGFYSYSDTFYGKVIYKPGKDHTITFTAQQQNTRRGYASYYSPNCLYRPKGFKSGGYVAPKSYFYCYDKAYFDNRVANGYVAYSGPYDNRIDETGLNLTWDWNLSELNTLSTQISFNNAWENYPVSTGQRYLANRVIDAQVRYTAELYKGNNLSTGFQYVTFRSIQVPYIGAPVGETFPPGTPPLYGAELAGRTPFFREITRWALYLTDDLKFFKDALIVNFGSRLTDDVAFGTFTTSGLGFRYNFGGPDPATAPFGLKFNWQQTFKAPGLTQLYLSSRTNIPNPNLQPELGAGYDIGLDVSLSPSSLFRITYYRIDLTNTILEGVQVLPRTVPLTPFRQSINAQATLATGWESVFDWKIDKNWSMYISQTFTDARPVGVTDADPQSQQGNPTAGGFFYGYQFPGTPWNNTGLRVQYDSPSFGATLSGRYVGIRPLLGQVNTLPSYITIDLTSRVPLTSAITLNLGLFNIFNEKYQTAPGLFGSNNSATIGYNNPGTTFRVGVDATF